MLVALLCCLTIVQAAEVEPSDEDGPALQSALFSLDGEQLAKEAGVLINTRFGGSASELFDHFNRFEDASKATGEQALGTQEVRALLKSIGLANFLLRGQLAAAFIGLCDSDGDHKISESELGAVVAVARCWLGPQDGPLQKAREVSRLAADAAGDWRKATPLLRAVRDCPAVLRFWARHRARLVELEEGPGPVASLAALASKGDDDCRAELGEGLAGGHTALRRRLKERGVGSLLGRVLGASALLLAADGDGDGALSRGEADAIATAACRLYSALSSRGGTAVGVADGFVRGGGYEPSELADALSAEAAAGEGAHSPALAAALGQSGALVSVAERALALAAAFVRRAPDRALRVRPLSEAERAAGAAVDAHAARRRDEL